MVAAALLALVLLILAVPAAADPPSLGRGTVLAEVERFHPGDFIWAPELAPSGPVLIVINRHTQRLIAYRNGIPIGITTVSTGRRGFTTPTGSYRVLQRRVEHYSSLYNNAPMPFMQRLTWGGVALHGGALPGFPASHGCIRLPHDFARLLYGVTRLGTPVVITDRRAMPRLGLSADLSATEQTLERHLAPGPVLGTANIDREVVTLVGSIADSRLLVLRNGEIVASSPMTAPGIRTLTAFRLGSDSSRAEWTRIPLTGQADGDTAVRSPFDLVSVDAAFQSAVEAGLGSGSTFVLVPDSLQTS
jgi:hypothetical protein